MSLLCWDEYITPVSFVVSTTLITVCCMFGSCVVPVMISVPLHTLVWCIPLHILHRFETNQTSRCNWLFQFCFLRLMFWCMHSVGKCSPDQKEHARVYTVVRVSLKLALLYQRDCVPMKNAVSYNLFATVTTCPTSSMSISLVIDLRRFSKIKSSLTCSRAIYFLISICNLSKTNGTNKDAYISVVCRRHS